MAYLESGSLVTGSWALSLAFTSLPLGFSHYPGIWATKRRPLPDSVLQPWTSCLTSVSSINLQLQFQQQTYSHNRLANRLPVPQQLPKTMSASPFTLLWSESCHTESTLPWKPQVQELRCDVLHTISQPSSFCTY